MVNYLQATYTQTRQRVHSVYLRFRLHLSPSLNGRMAIWWQNSCKIEIRLFRKSWSNGWMLVRWLFCLWIAIWLFDQLYLNLMNSNLVTVLSPDCHSAFQTPTQTKTEPEVFRKHARDQPIKNLNQSLYRSGTLNSNTVNSKFHLIRSFFQILATILSFHV